MKKRDLRYFDLISRYLILLFIALPNLYLFYLIFTPLTILPLYFILNLFFEVSLHLNTIFLNGLSIQVVESCIAGSAYYLLLILNLSIPQIAIKKRLKMIAFAFSTLLILNILRIIILVCILLSMPSIFDITHQIFWYIISLVFVIGIWFLEVKIFNIKQIPFYSDFKYVIKQIK
jgi:exosortase/archaeosortase family protein